MSPAAPEKLIRDRIPELAAAQRRQLTLRLASPDDMVRLLGLKLVEETHEVLDAVHTGSAIRVLDELADLQTVIEAIGARHGLSRQDIDQRAAEKIIKRGGFEAGYVLQGSAAAPASTTNRLHSRMGPSLLDALKQEFETCRVARLAVAFVMQSGLELIEGAALAALLRGAELRILTTDYLGVTEPAALSRLASWHGNIQTKVYSHARRSFHPKAYLFERVDGSGRAFIGSANLSRMALTEGVEWTWSVLDVDVGQPMYELTTRFEELFKADASQPLTPDWVRDYAGRREVATRSISGIETPLDVQLTDGDRVEICPREVQQLALRELERLRQDGETRALVVAATGLGKTFLAAFDAREAERVLFVAHREELLRQAEAAFKAIYPTRSIGWLADGRDELDRDVVFASVQTISRHEHLARPELSRFDYVVIDEFHHAAADSYLRVLRALSPRFLLGLTATPFRGDQRDLLSLCDGNLAYQVGLLEAITYGWLVPFHYYGVADVVTYTDDLLTARKTYDAGRLTLRFNTAERAALALEHYRKLKGRATLGFCMSISHADFMADEFRKAGVPAAAVHSGVTSMNRTEAVHQLENGQVDVLFTVDLFNEGVDIPVVDLVMFLRPTESMTIYMQQLGRGLRLQEGKAYLKVLDFIGNYRCAHVMLPLLAGQDISKDSDAGKALRALNHWIQDKVRPDGVPDGIEIAIDQVALRTLRESLDKASPLRQLVLDDLAEMTEGLGRPPTLTEWQRHGCYSLRTACNALGVDRWHRVLDAGGLLDSETRALEATVGEFLREIERTAMTKSFKMVVLQAMCRTDTFSAGLPIKDLVVKFREYFTLERHRDDVIGTEVEAVATVDEHTWQGYLQRNPIAAWTRTNTKNHSRYFSWDGTRREFRYIGPTPKEDLHAKFAQAVADRIQARLETYWQRPGPGRFVFNVIPAGGGDDSRNLCIMFGTNRDGLPTGWHLVKINGRHLYGNFVKVALNVLKEQPTDDRAVPNLLTVELLKLLQGTKGRKHRVRFIRQTGAESWEIQRA
jgi:superfamily II DNA or RNA helicase/HKD family nuclease/predicted house-cleaning noncanonical NTP pyrophosphatase (MazG superfamily)